MANPDDGQSPSDRDAPLADVVSAIEERQAQRSDRDEAWVRLASQVEGRDTDDVWAQLDAEETVTLDGVEPEATPTTTPSVIDRIGKRDVILSATTGGLLLVVAVGIYLATMLGVIPPQFWVFTLLPLAGTFVLIIPALTYLLGIWNPGELGYVREMDTKDDLPRPDRIEEG